MVLFKKSHDADSGVTSYSLIEWKERFSIVLLHFSPGSRDAFHNHAFDAYTWWLKGPVIEEFSTDGIATVFKVLFPSWRPKYTPKSTLHRIVAGPEGAWALSIRGPWSNDSQEQ